MRNFSTPGLVLSVKPQGENNRSTCIFSPAEGIFYATLFGGPKSKMRSLVSPMNSGTFYLSRDEVKKQTKITDFDVKKTHMSFRENLFKTFASALAAEIIISTKCAGSLEESWRLINGFIDGMELSTEKESRLGLIRFLWRYINLLGVKPDTARCFKCGESLHSQKFNLKTSSLRYYFDAYENGFSCPDCTPSDFSKNERGVFQKDHLFLSRTAVTYLEAISTLSPKEVRKIIIGTNDFSEIKNLCYFLIEKNCGKKLKSMEAGTGIL